MGDYIDRQDIRAEAEAGMRLNRIGAAIVVVLIVIGVALLAYGSRSLWMQ